MTLEYGPLLILACAGIYIMVRYKKWQDSWEYEIIILFAVCFFFILFVLNPIENNFGLLKATRVVPLAITPLAILYCEKLKGQKFVKTITIVMCILAFPSIFVDNYLASDIKNPSTYILKSDLAATKWIKTHVPLEAIVQAEPNYPGKYKGKAPKYYYSLIPVFAHRKTAIGEWKVSQLEHGSRFETEVRFKEIEFMFYTDDALKCKEIAKKYKIQYIYIGERERKKYGGSLDKFYETTDIFRPVYNSNSVDIFFVIG
jgi:uncharacterized membrane protein